jgi:NADH:ubiquinone oxidoreductase subunit 3 (subunit A)
MTSNWDSYYLVLLSALLSLSIPLFLAGISFVFSHRNQRKRSVSLQPAHPLEERPIILGQRIHIQFFLAANAAVVLITIVLLLIPCVTVLQSGKQEFFLNGLLAIISISGFISIGLFYAVRKGDMGWLSSPVQENERM